MSVKKTADRDDDPIVAEVRKVREDYARSHNNDLDSIVEDIRQREKGATDTVRRDPKPVSTRRKQKPAA